MTPPKKKTIAQLAEEGEYTLVEPLDYLILDELTAEGTTLAGLYELGTTSKEIQKKYKQLTGGTISGRLRIMASQGLCRKVKIIGDSGGGSASWQRTQLGSTLLAGWKEGNSVSH